MGIDVYLTNEDFRPWAGVPPAEDPHNKLAKLLPLLRDDSFQCLRFIDPYGNTIFNGMQMDQFLAELERIAPNAKTPTEVELLYSIRALAEKCKSEVHTYLMFVGD